ncbi:hypothetical protein WR25_05314 [Diploscapter pachys]|uniref:C2H2-type domain-containing protein n=1 Tax=Diploscapter pachys TaxID=2018661 RepID=A0A2A2JBY1_9BILA|nr:hypothetical protein WR25_05314 [Diploscapter pachys]
MQSLSNEWSRSNSYSGPLSVTSQDRLDEIDDILAQGEQINPNNRLDDLPPLSLDVDELRTHSSTGSLSSSSTGLPAFTCESCKKSVSSSRSLKRHQTTCKQYIAEHGPPPDSDYPRLSTAANTCEDCNRQLCSASNLKRHKATCKVIMQKNGEFVDRGEILQQRIAATRKPRPPWPAVHIKPNERQIIDRSYAAALAACSESKIHRPLSTGSCPAPATGTSISTSTRSVQLLSQSPPLLPLGINSSSSNSGDSTPRIRVERPFITVGEHLKAQVQQQQRLMEQLNQRSLLKSEASPPPIQPSFPPSRLRTYQVIPKSMVSPTPVPAVQNQPEKEEVKQQAVKIEDVPLPLTSTGGAYSKTEEERKEDEMCLARKNSAILQKEDEICEIKKPHGPLDSIITTQPLMSDRINASYSNAGRGTSTERSSDAIQTTLPAGSGLSAKHIPAVFARGQMQACTEYQCPECFKTYSCRKNVKRHRMAVHKQTPDEIASNPGQVIHVSPNSMVSCSSTLLSSPTTGSQQVRKEMEEWSPSWGSGNGSQNEKEYGDDEMESVETARIAAELKRSAEEELAGMEEKRPKPELAEADTTFHEETDMSNLPQNHLPPTILPESGSIQSRQVPEIPANERETNGQFHPNSEHFNNSTYSIPVNQRYDGQNQVSNNNSNSPNRLKIHTCVDCNRILSSDYSLRRHRMTCPEVKSALTKSDKDEELLMRNSNSIENSSGPFQNWFGSNTEEADSTTSQRRDRSTSPVFRNSNDISPVESGPLPIPYHQPPAISDALSTPNIPSNPPMAIISPMVISKTIDEVASNIPQDSSLTIVTTQRRCRNGTSLRQNISPYGSSTGSPASGNGQKARHHCQDCDKYYSSEWNLERHRRESCPYKEKSREQTLVQQDLPQNQEPSANLPPAGANGEPLIQQPTSLQDEVCVQVRTTRFYVSRAALSRSSGYFAQIFPQGEPIKPGDVRLDIDPHAFQCLLDVHNCRMGLSATNIDTVIDMANKLKFNAVLSLCEDFISNSLPHTSVMHAIRLADHHKLNQTKQKLFDTISLDVFRSLSADQNYRMMSADLKAELLEKWGSFL